MSVIIVIFMDGLAEFSTLGTEGHSLMIATTEGYHGTNLWVIFTCDEGLQCSIESLETAARRLRCFCANLLSSEFMD